MFVQEQGLASSAQAGWKVGTYAAICLLRGQVYNALENRILAIRW
jgi:hypothetical protein